MYRANLEFILVGLMGMTSRVIWASTTPVHPDRSFHNNAWSWRNEEIDEYNASARELMEMKGVPINDLHRLVWHDLTRMLGDDQLHLSERGKQVCAGAVAAAVSAVLPE